MIGVETHFIYCPLSGDRVFKENASPEILIVRWQNGSRHIVGGVRLTYYASDPGEYWREAAVRAASQFLSVFPGVAWDDQGQINLIVPVRYAYLAGDVMEMIAPQNRSSVRNIGKLFRAGCVSLEVFPGMSNSLVIYVPVADIPEVIIGYRGLYCGRFELVINDKPIGFRGWKGEMPDGSMVSGGRQLPDVKGSDRDYV